MVFLPPFISYEHFNPSLKLIDSINIHFLTWRSYCNTKGSYKSEYFKYKFLLFFHGYRDKPNKPFKPFKNFFNLSWKFWNYHISGVSKKVIYITMACWQKHFFLKFIGSANIFLTACMQYVKSRIKSIPIQVHLEKNIVVDKLYTQKLISM